MKNKKRILPRKIIIGIDEAGRGPLAGPVVVAGVRFSGKRFPTNHKALGKLKDSKKLGAAKREAWFKFFKNYPDIEWAHAVISSQAIDLINISEAANLGAWRVYAKLSQKKLIPAKLDGSLFLPEFVPHQTIIKGDEKMAIIAAASIFAKVKRDSIMNRLDKKYPRYDFATHKGYGTKKHRQLIRKHGLSPVHRRSFKLKK